MGAGASTLSRLRKALIIRAYNLRKADETLEEQFKKFARFREDSVLVITLEDIKECLILENEHKWMEDMMRACFLTEENAATQMYFADFMIYLETGKIPKMGFPGFSTSNNSSGSSSKARSAMRAEKERSLRNSAVDPFNLQGGASAESADQHRNGLKIPPNPPGSSSEKKEIRRTLSRETSIVEDYFVTALNDAISADQQTAAAGRAGRSGIPGGGEKEESASRKGTPRERPSSNNQPQRQQQVGMRDGIASAVMTPTSGAEEGGGRRREEDKEEQAERGHEEGEEEEPVISINLSSIHSMDANLPPSIKVDPSHLPAGISFSRQQSHDYGPEDHVQCESVIVHPTKAKRVIPFSGSGSGLVGSEGENSRQLWRKREVVKQERSVFYTTVDADGTLQELVEQETTQTEVLHMECRETGEFAHRESTQYEQQELFNDEVVGQQRGDEVYVHMKSVNDEYQFMDSTMPSRTTQEDGAASAGGAGSGAGAGAGAGAPEGGEQGAAGGLSFERMIMTEEEYLSAMGEAQAAAIAEAEQRAMEKRAETKEGKEVEGEEEDVPEIVRYSEDDLREMYQMYVREQHEKYLARMEAAEMERSAKEAAERGVRGEGGEWGSNNNSSSCTSAESQPPPAQEKGGMFSPPPTSSSIGGTAGDTPLTADSMRPAAGEYMEERGGFGRSGPGSPGMGVCGAEQGQGQGGDVEGEGSMTTAVDMHIHMDTGNSGFFRERDSGFDRERDEQLFGDPVTLDDNFMQFDIPAPSPAIPVPLTSGADATADEKMSSSSISSNGDQKLERVPKPTAAGSGTSSTKCGDQQVNDDPKMGKFPGFNGNGEGNEGEKGQAVEHSNGYGSMNDID